MCNHSSLFKLPVARTAISSFVLALTALTLLVAAEAPAQAQIAAERSLFGNPSDQFDMMSSGVRMVDNGLGSFPTPPVVFAPSQSKISADELRHPLSGKARSVLLKAWNYSTKGDHLRAIATIKDGMEKVRSLVPYGHAFLGIEYVRTGRPRDAVAELQESAEFFPHDAPGHSNLALSLCLTGDLDGAEREAKLALYLEPTLATAAEIVRIVEEEKVRRPSRAANPASND